MIELTSNATLFLFPSKYALCPVCIRVYAIRGCLNILRRGCRCGLWSGEVNLNTLPPPTKKSTRSEYFRGFMVRRDVSVCLQIQYANFKIRYTGCPRLPGRLL